MRDPMQKMTKGSDSGFWYNLCFATIGVSAVLYTMGRRNLGVFVGLWPPTFAALGNRAEINEELVKLVRGEPIEKFGHQGERVSPQTTQRRPTA